jgi:alginate O-acetyltransferase complex protein AlgI
VYTLSAVGVGWVLFRTETLGECMVFLSALAGLNPARGGQPFGFFVDNQLVLVLIAAAFGSTAMPKHLLAAATRRVPEWAAISGLLLGVSGLLVLCGAKVAAGAYSPFIYFRF